MSGTDYSDWRVGGGGNATINSVVLPLVINSEVLSVNNSTTTTSGVVIINDLYTSIPSHTDATTSFFVTQAIAAAIVSGKSFRGGYDASSGAYPSTGGSGTAGAVQAGDYWVVTVAGTVGLILVLVGDTLTALIQNPGQISTNWFINAAGVSSVFGRFGNIVAVSGDYNISQITNGLSNVLPSENIFVGNGSGIATGVSLSGDISISNTGLTTLATVNATVGSFGSSTSIPSFTVNEKGLITAAGSSVVIAPAGTLTGTTLASNVVSSSLTSVGTLITGIWNATPIDLTNYASGILQAAQFPALTGDVTNTVGSLVTAISNTTVTGKLLTGYVAGTNTPIVATDSILTAFENLQAQVSGTSGAAITSLTGDATAIGPGASALTLATVNSNVGSFGSSTAIPNFTVNGKGLLTAAGSSVVIAPAGTLTGTTLNSTVVSSSLTSVGILTSGDTGATQVVDPTTTTSAALNLALSNILAASGGTGTVTSVSVVSANGLAGTVATASTTPAITLSTTVTGLVKGDGTALSAAVSGTDYSAGTSALGTGILKSTTGTGALTIAVAADFPILNQSTTGNATTATTSTNLAGTTVNSIPYQSASATTGYVAPINNAVLATNGSGVPSLVTTLPAVNSGSTVVTDPTTATTAALNTALSNILAAPGGTGTVTSVSVVTANGLSGTVANPSTTPAITIATSVTGILYGNGSSIAAAIAANFPTLNQNTTGYAAGIAGGLVNQILYQTAANTTGFISVANNAVLATNGSGVPSLVTTLPAINGGSLTGLTGTLNSSVNSMTVAVNSGTASSPVNIINSNALGLTGATLTSIINGVVSNTVSVFPSFAFISIASQNLLSFGVTQNVLFSNYGYVKNNQSNITVPANITYSFTLGIGIFYVEANLYATGGSTGWAKFQITNGSGTLIGSSNKAGFVQTTGAAGQASDWTASAPATSIINVTSGTTQVFINIFQIASGYYIVLSAPDSSSGSFVKVTQIG